MADLKAVDRTYAEKYLGRWIIGADVILDEVFDKDVTLVQEDFTHTDDPGMKFLIYGPINGKMDPVNLAPPIGATPVYMQLSSAIGLVVMLKNEIKSGTLEKLAEPMLYSMVGKESLVAVYLAKPVGDEEGWEIKQVLNGIAGKHNAQIITFEMPRKGKFRSIDFKFGLRLKS